MMKSITPDGTNKYKEIIKQLTIAAVIIILTLTAAASLFFIIFFLFGLGSCIYVKELKEEEALYLLSQGRSPREIRELDNYLSSSGLRVPTQALKKYVSARSRGGRENNIRGGA